MKFVEYIVLDNEDVQDYGEVPSVDDILSDDYISVALYCIDTEEIEYFGDTNNNCVNCEIGYFLRGVEFGGFDVKCDKEVLIVPDDCNKYNFNQVKYEIRKQRGEL